MSAENTDIEGGPVSFKSIRGLNPNLRISREMDRTKGFSLASLGDFYLKVTQINYVSRNQLHSTANLDFGSIGKKAKHCWALSTSFLV